MASRLVPLLGLLACAPSLELEPEPESEQSLADEAFRAFTLAGPIESLSYHVVGSVNPVNEGLVPGDPAPTLPRTDFTMDVVFDVTGSRLRLDRQGTMPGFGVTFEQVDTIDGELGAAEGSATFGAPVGLVSSDRVTALQRLHRLTNPTLLVQDVADDPSLLLGVDVAFDQGALWVGLRLDDPVAPIDLQIELSAKPTIRRLLTEENDLLLRDSEVEITFADWQVLPGGWRMPHQVEVWHDGHLLRTEERSGYEVNAVVDDESFAFPPGPAPVFDPSLASLGERSSQAQLTLPPPIRFPDGRPTTVVPVEVTPGVTFLTGIAHNSMLVEHSDRLVLVEAPSYPERSDAIAAWAEANIPGKPITHVIATHHHVDHTAGLRSFVARGATVVVGEPTADFFRDDVFQRPSTIVPDLLSTMPVEEPEVIAVPVDQSWTLDDPVHPISVISVPSMHAADMVVIHLPADEILFNSDLYSGGAGLGGDWPALANELHTAIESRGLAVSWMPAGHSPLVPSYADFLAEFGF